MGVMRLDSEVSVHWKMIDSGLHEFAQANLRKTETWYKQKFHLRVAVNSFMKQWIYRLLHLITRVKKTMKRKIVSDWSTVYNLDNDDKIYYVRTL